ncbi:MAG: hypothetical protein Tsb0033_06600 [Winogradskyella sp.]
MSHLFSKRAKTSVLVFCFSILLFSLTSFPFSNDESFSKTCEKSEAYYLHSFKDVTYVKNWAGYKRYVAINNKLVVNTIKGVEDYAFLNLDDYVSNHLESIKIRTLKADGTIVELDSSLVFDQKSDNKKFGAIYYPIPSVEPGDTIETDYVYYENLRGYELMDYVDFNSALPSINSQYTIKTGQDLQVRYKTYNEFPTPRVVANDTMVYLQFSRDSIKSLVSNEYNCLPCEKPYFYYTLEKKESELRTWKDVYNEEFNFLTQPMALDYERSSYYKRWKRRVIGEAKDSSKYYKFNLLHKEVLKTISIEPLKDGQELIKSSGYFLKEERFDPLSIRRFYRQVLEDLDIKYWAVFGREKRLGPIDVNLIRKGEFAHIFFAIENEKGHLKFLYPHEEDYKYLIDEIPTSLYDTRAVLVKPVNDGEVKRKDRFINRDFKLAEADSILVEVINLPSMNADYNYVNQTVFTKVDLEEKKLDLRYRFKVSGGTSTDLRSFFEMLDNNEEAEEYYDALWEYEGDDNTIQIDSVLNRIQSDEKPFGFVFDAKGTLNNVVKFVNDSLVSVSLDKLIKHNQIEDASDKSTLSYYMDYSYSDLFMLNIEFPCKIEVLGMDDSNVRYNNKYSEYVFDVKAVNENQLKIISYYKILDNYIPNNDLNDIKILNEHCRNTKKRRLLVKLKQQD